MKPRIWHVEALRLAETGLSWRQVAKQLDVPKSSVSDFLRWHKTVAPTVSTPACSSSFKHMIATLRDSGQQSKTFRPKVREVKKFKPTILIIADTQAKPTESLGYLEQIGKYIAEKRPDIIVHIGDHWDMPSLSSYDRGKRSFEGRRISDDLEAGTKGLELLQSQFSGIEGYNPRLVFCLGNHEDRLDRCANDLPEFAGTIGTDQLPLEDMGWEVVPYLKPIEIEGFFFVHYLANPFTGKPYGGTAATILKTVGRSFVVGHKQLLDIAIRPTIDGKQQIGIVNGAAYPFNEGYKGYQGNNHFRGITVLHEVSDGFAVPMFVSMDYLKDNYS